MAFKVNINGNVQYASREAGIKAHAEDYSFNIESELFHQLTPEQQKLWRKEIEQAVLSGGYCGLELANDRRYDKQEPVSEDLEEVIRKYEQRLEKENPATEAYDFASAIRFGAKWQKDKLMAKAIDGLVVCNNLTHGYKDILMEIPSYLNVDDEVKVIVIKED